MISPCPGEGSRSDVIFCVSLDCSIEQRSKLENKEKIISNFYCVEAKVKGKVMIIQVSLTLCQLNL